MACSRKNLKRRYALFCCLMSLLLYTLMTYGGIRSPDSELVFRTAESLLIRHTWAVEESLPWETFGLREGKDGNRYAWFGPAEAVLLVPFIGVASWLCESPWYENFASYIPISHYYDGGLFFYMTGRQPPDIAPHALRMLVSCFNVIVSAAAVTIFFWLMTLLTEYLISALYTTIFLAFGSLLFPYSGTFFSEPLATLWVISSLYFLVLNQYQGHNGKRMVLRNVILSGILLGTAVATHISAILFVPFFWAYALVPFFDRHHFIKSCLKPGIVFMGGFLIPCTFLGYYNFIRFGDVLETGRTADAARIETGFVMPWENLKHLLISAGKGVLWFNPAIFLSVFCWRRFHSKNPVISWMCISILVSRVLFLACRSDWHAGFGLGPRYLVMALPLVFIPVGRVLDDLFRQGQKRAVWIMAGYMFMCMAQQLYFCIGEIFYFLNFIKLRGLEQGFNVFQNDYIFVEWSVSPLFSLLNGKRGPFTLQFFPGSNYLLWYLFVGLCGFLFYWMTKHILRKFADPVGNI